MGTSSANPDKLATYSTDGLGLVQTLKSKSDAVTRAIEALSASRSRHLPALGDAHTTFADLVGDWQHLDEFVGDVGQGFRRADSGGGVITVSDSDIGRLGQVGFADRDAAIRAAQEAQRQLDDLLHRPPDEVSAQDLQALFAAIGRGQYDPAFAVTFSEGVGVAGYVDAMTLIEQFYAQNHDRIPAEGHGYAAVLGTTLTTALDTVHQDPEDYRDPENAGLADGDRLDYGFVVALASGYRGQDHARGWNPDDENPNYPRQNAEPVDLDRNLSVLLSYTDPPTWVAVDVANGRLSPYLEEYVTDTGLDTGAHLWGDRSGLITNYASMLSRNSDASTLWLYGQAPGLEHDNLELVLERATGTDMDEGRALAQIVQNGLTNTEVHESVPGAPSYVEGRPMREALMERTIDYIGTVDEIHNGHLHMAFAAGVDANMNVIDERINAPFGYDEGERPDGVLDEYLNTHDFLRETMRNGDAAREIYLTVQEYGMEQAQSLPTDPDELEARLRQLGRIQGVVSEAEENAGVGAVLDEMLQNGALGPSPGSLTNAGVGVVAGFIPGLGSVHEVSQALGVSAGDFVNWGAHELFNEDYDNLTREQQEAAAQRATDRLNRAIWLSTGLLDDDTPQGAALRASAQGQPFLNPDGSIKTDMTDAEMQAYREWAWDAVGNDADQGPIYTEHGDIGTGYNDVHEGETDVNDRR